MPKVRTYYSQVQSNALTGGAQATGIRALTDDGKQALYGAAADLGNFGMQLGLKEMAFNDSISQAKAVQIMRNAELDYQTKIAKDPDTNNWSKYHKEVVQNAQAEIKKLKFGTNKGQKQNDIEVSTWNGIFTKSAQVKMIKQKSRDALAVAEAAYEAESEYDDGTPDSAVKINAARNAYQEALKNSYSPEVAKVILAKTDAKINAQKAYNIAYGNALGLAQRGGWDAALQQINDPKWQAQSGLSPDDIEKLTNQIENQKTASEKMVKAQQDKDLAGIYDKMNSGAIPDYDLIQNSSLPETGEISKQSIREKWDKVYQNKIQGYDPQTYAQLLKDVTLNPDKYTRNDLAAKIGNGLDVEKYKEISSVLDGLQAKDTYQRNLHRTYVNAISDLQTKRFFDLDPIKNIEISTQAQVALENWSKNKPDATSADYETFFKTLTMPNIKSYGPRIDAKERQEILDNTGVDLYDGIDLWGINIPNKAGEQAAKIIEKKKTALLQQSKVEQVAKRRDGESIEEYLRRTGK